MNKEIKINTKAEKIIENMLAEINSNALEMWRKMNSSEKNSFAVELFVGCGMTATDALTTLFGAKTANRMLEVVRNEIA